MTEKLKTWKDLNLEERDYPYPEPEWSAENISRKNGDTTFKQCGWCKYATSGTGRYTCMISSHCKLLKSYGIGRDVYWDTPCIVKMLGKTDFDSIIKSKEHDIRDLENSIQRHRDEISTIKTLEPKNTPPLPNNRMNDFDINEIVWVFVHNKWERGTVVTGYRTHDGFTTHILDNYPETKEHPWGCGVSVPCILKDWEFKYFKENHEDFRLWLTLSDRKYNGERMPMQKMYESLIHSK